MHREVRSRTVKRVLARGANVWPWPLLQVLMGVQNFQCCVCAAFQQLKIYEKATLPYGRMYSVATPFIARFQLVTGAIQQTKCH